MVYSRRQARGFDIKEKKPEKVTRFPATMESFREDEMIYDGVASNKCPIAGSKVSWQVAKKSFRRWAAGSDMKAEIMANHIISRGFCKNKRFLAAADLMSEQELSERSGLEYLFREMDKLERTGDSAAQFGRIQELLGTARNNDEPIEDYVRRFRRILNLVNEDDMTSAFQIQKTKVKSVDDLGVQIERQKDSQHLAALLMIAGAKISPAEMANLSVLIDISEKTLTVREAEQAMQRCLYGKRLGKQEYAMAMLGTHESEEATRHNEDARRPWQNDETTWDANGEWVLQDHNIWYCYEDGKYYVEQEDGRNTEVEQHSEGGKTLWVDSCTYLQVNQCRSCKRFGHWGNECPYTKGKKGGMKGLKNGKGKGRSAIGYGKGGKKGSVRTFFGRTEGEEWKSVNEGFCKEDNMVSYTAGSANLCFGSSVAESKKTARLDSRMDGAESGCHKTCRNKGSKETSHAEYVDKRLQKTEVQALSTMNSEQEDQNEVLAVSNNQFMACTNAPTVSTLDIGCALAMGSDQAVKNYVGTMRKEGYRCIEKPSCQTFCFAGGNAEPATSNGKFVVPVPIVGGVTSYESVSMAGGSDQATPLLTSLEQLRNLDAILYLREGKMTVRHANGHRICIETPMNESKHITWDLNGKPTEQWPRNKDFQDQAQWYSDKPSKSQDFTTAPLNRC